MCWNEYVSLNTFVFSTFVLLFVMYNNAYTPYKIKGLNNVSMYLFLFSVILMQLIEFFLWRNINHPVYNVFFTIMVQCLLFLQPVFSLLLLSQPYVKTLLLGIYFLFVCFLGVVCFLGFGGFHKLTNLNSWNKILPLFVSTKSKWGHLHWGQQYLFIEIIWLFFLVFSFVWEKNIWGLGFGSVLLFISVLNYVYDNTWGSMWCWSLNSASLFFAIYLLIFLPFIEKKNMSKKG